MNRKEEYKEDRYTLAGTILSLLGGGAFLLATHANNISCDANGGLWFSIPKGKAINGTDVIHIVREKENVYKMQGFHRSMKLGAAIFSSEVPPYPQTFTHHEIPGSELVNIFRSETGLSATPPSLPVFGMVGIS